MEDNRFYNGPIAPQYWPDICDSPMECDDYIEEDMYECTCVSGCMQCLDLSYNDFL